MGAPTPNRNEEVPAYEELYSRPPSNPSTGYSHIPTTAADTPDLTIDIERTAHKHHPHHQQRSTLPPSPTFELDETPTPDPQPPQPSEGPHFHCAECDRQMDSRERRRLCAKVTNAVTGTLMIISFFVMIGYIFMVMRR
ncbi:Uncharacterized protein PECH_004059 [Penicillium ucsense]|uniref:Uncharacterized protein n=1 Tax=Penicillium ucsense TaxID=2839758 RepID=A0A8J8W378_9EURO|nr:Uncharacterized protein PECM_004739 [Penicillium ucsense]KAF7737359.1 Uncharacterized protein PECH_004059 [Penicillium ucsense]